MGNTNGESEEVKRLFRWLDQSKIDIPVAHDRREELQQVIMNWTASKDYDAKLYNLMRRVRDRIKEQVRRNGRPRPFYPAVQIPCTPKEEQNHTILKDQAEHSFFRVLVDREIEKILRHGPELYMVESGPSEEDTLDS